MSPTPEVQPLSQQHRRRVFIISLLIFCVSVPLLVFYAIGYRFDFSEESGSIKSVGGIYITADSRDLQIFVDDKPVEDMRIFQNAAYIQNLPAGIHQVHTQGDAVQTWVKDLPVFSHIVTEVASFNIPKVPQVRLITEYETAEGDSVLFQKASSTPLVFASSTNLFFFATTSATTTFDKNPEWAYVDTLFASSTEKKKQLQELRRQQKLNNFRFITSSSSSLISSATTTKTKDNLVLFEKEGEVYARWDGRQENIPYYFCIKYGSASSTSALYGEHIYNGLAATYSSLNDFSQEIKITDRLCRDMIRIDRQGQNVRLFDFLPGGRDLVLMHLEDGVYVVEIDDRAWQNVQLLYPGDVQQVIVEGGHVFIKDGPYYLEVFTKQQ